MEQPTFAHGIDFCPLARAGKRLLCMGLGIDQEALAAMLSPDLHTAE